ncbi:MAG: adenylosuccinate synthetase, partial [Planctomycetota bacterium]
MKKKKKAKRRKAQKKPARKPLRTMCVIGVQWGDEGKGKIVDILSRGHDYVVRFQGGANAGHTVVVDEGKFVLHHVPSGILHRGTVCVIGNGVVLDPDGLLDEVAELRKRGVRIGGNFAVSERAHLVMPYHKMQDALSEKRSLQKIGTTQRGIGPCYADKVARKGLRVADLFRPQAFRERLRRLVQEKASVFRALYGEADLDTDAIYRTYLRYAEELRPFVTDTIELINRAIDKGKRVLFEGAQGSLLD